MSESYVIADYLFDRIAEASATEVFGVPGDYNLEFLDNLLGSDKLRWVGNNNELNAGYTADGYARERGFAAMITTFGVGELSAINATAGSYAEYAPVLHVVGAPTTEQQNAQRRIHHSLGDGVFNHFIKMVEPVTVAHAQITAKNAASEIDRVIRRVLKERRPGYILLPLDVAKMPIYPPTTELKDSEEHITSQIALNAFKEALTDFMPNKTTTLIADLMVQRLKLQNELKALIADTDIPYTTLSWGKSLLNEQSSRWAGTYGGFASQAVAKDAVENAECLIKIGVNYTDMTTAGFSQDIDEQAVIDLHYESASIGGKSFAPIALKDSLQALHEVMTSGITITPKPLSKQIKAHKQRGKDDEPIRQNDLWHIVACHLTQNSVVFADLGTAYFGMGETRLPEGVTYYGQPLWGSIGYTLPASFGASMASPNKRGVLLIGDGAAILTVQEIALMIQEGTNPIIVLINNEGYAIERTIHGENQRYNDIPPVDWQMVPKTFGGTDKNTLCLRAETAGELKETLKKANETTDKLVLLEVMTDKHDVPDLLQEVSDAL